MHLVSAVVSPPGSRGSPASLFVTSPCVISADKKKSSVNASDRRGVPGDSTFAAIPVCFVADSNYTHESINNLR